MPLVIERVICKETPLRANLRDILMRGIVRETSRRVLLGALSGIGLASLATVLVANGDVDARKRKRKKKCKGDTKKCGKRCIPSTECCGGCPADAICTEGVCIFFCPTGESECDGTCVNLATDGDNCGACGNVCDTGACVHGACACVSADNCPDGCFCSPRKQGGSVCSSGAAEPQCDTDEECPLRSVCVQFIDLCSNPCLG